MLVVVQHAISMTKKGMTLILDLGKYILSEHMVKTKKLGCERNYCFRRGRPVQGQMSKAEAHLQNSLGQIMWERFSDKDLFICKSPC